MKLILTNFSLLLSVFSYSQALVNSEDLKIIIGNWKGTITYLDYQTQKPFSMPANLEVTQGSRNQKLILKNNYPREPKANNSDKIKISKNGTALNNHEVISRTTLANGDIQIITQYHGKDDHKKALIKQTYLLGNEVFIIIKEVQFNQKDVWIKRSEYNYQKLPK